VGIHSAIVGIVLLAISVPPASDLTSLGATDTAPFRIDGKGFVTDSSHPKHPGDFFRADVTARCFFDPALGEAVIEFDSGEGDERTTDRYYFRRGRIFQIGDDGSEVDAAPLGDLAAATVAALQPRLTAIAMRERAENESVAENREVVLAWNDVLWRFDKTGERLERRTRHDLFGDGVEVVQYRPNSGGKWNGAIETTVTHGDRVVASLEFAAPVPVDSIAMADGNRDRDRARVIAYHELQMEPLAEHVYAIDIASMNTRVVIAEFTDFLLVFEGVYNSRNVDLVVKYVHDTMKKPVRYFAFSHLHGQYIGGTRSWIHAGATILVPPSTQPMVEKIAQASFKLMPDALARERKPLRVETIAKSRLIEDGTNALEIFNVESAHTDEYFVVYFPRAKVLLTGDLLFYRPGQPLKGRSKLLCETVTKLGIDVERYVATWPLDGYGTKNIVTRDEMKAACAAQ